MNKEKNFVSAVVYVHNAEERISKFLEMLVDVLDGNFEHSEIICVNDCSEDSSAAQVKKFGSGARSVSITVLNMSYFHGLEIAMNAGVDLAIGDFVFEFDTTVLDFDSAEIMKIYYRSLEGYDIVSAVPDKREKLMSTLFYKVFDRFTNLTYDMRTESFRILSRRVINRINSMSKAVPYRKALYANCGLKTDTVTYSVKNAPKIKRDKTEKKYRGRLAVDSLILFTDVGYFMSITMTVIMMLCSIFMVVYSLAVYLTSNPVAGWTTTVLFLSVSLFGLFGVLTVIIKYLQILINLVFRRKQYSFESIEKITK